MKLNIKEVQAKSILIKSGLPASDWVINPYNGCLFGCMYCYAAQITRWWHPNEEWGSYLDVKINAPKLLKKELNNLARRHSGERGDEQSTSDSRIKNRDSGRVHSSASWRTRSLARTTTNKDFGSIFFSSITDPYVSSEEKYRLTRKCLNALLDFGYQGTVSILTKSPLVTRDIDLFKKFKNIEVGMTVTGLDDKVSRFLEVKAPPVTSRIKALQVLSQNGINTYAFVGPIVPYFIHNEEKIKEIIDTLEKIGVKKIWFEHLNLSPKIKERLFKYLQKESPGLIPEFERKDTEEYRNQLDEIIYRQMKGRKIKMGYGKVIYHNKLPKKI